MIDTSASLVVGDDGVEPSDPSAVRVDAATLLLKRLSDTLAKYQIAIDVAIAGFDADVSQAVDFTPLTGDQLPGLESAVAAFADKNTGTETDYWSALNWINTSLEKKQQARGEATSCQLAIWFTDGEFSLSGNSGSVEQPEVPGFESTVISDAETAQSVQAAAAKELCRVGGPADQMRQAGITMIAVGLGGKAADYNQEQFSLQNYAENPGLVCGGQPGSGLFIPAGSVGELVLAFDVLTKPGGGEVVRPVPKTLCQRTVCPEGVYTFKLDDSLDVVHVAAVLENQGKAMSTAGIAVQLTGPGGVICRDFRQRSRARGHGSSRDRHGHLQVVSARCADPRPAALRNSELVR